MDSRDRFTDAAADYARHRPDYPEAVADTVAAYGPLAAGASVVDIGAGTGISSRLFAARGFDVTGVEPNEAMLEQARRAGGARYVRGDAGATYLDASCADAITCGQALHWFDLEASAGEWRRILRPGGCCAAFWNLRRADGWQAEYEALLERWSTEYVTLQKARDGEREHDVWIRESGRCRDVEDHEFDHAQILDFAGLLGRANSSSYVVHGIADRPGFERALRALFEEHETDGRVVFRYRTSLLLWRFAP